MRHDTVPPRPQLCTLPPPNPRQPLATDQPHGVSTPLGSTGGASVPLPPAVRPSPPRLMIDPSPAGSAGRRSYEAPGYGSVKKSGSDLSECGIGPRVSVLQNQGFREDGQRGRIHFPQSSPSITPFVTTCRSNERRAPESDGHDLDRVPVGTHDTIVHSTEKKSYVRRGTGSSLTRTSTISCFQNSNENEMKPSSAVGPARITSAHAVLEASGQSGQDRSIRQEDNAVAGKSCLHLIHRKETKAWI